MRGYLPRGRAGSELTKIYNNGAWLVEGFWFGGAVLRGRTVVTRA
jgi:hypothetical protein